MVPLMLVLPLRPHPSTVPQTLAGRISEGDSPGVVKTGLVSFDGFCSIYVVFVVTRFRGEVGYCSWRYSDASQSTVTIS